MRSKQSVRIANGAQTPVAQIPRLDYDTFADAVLAEFDSGSRVAAYFAAPETDGRLELYAVMARERNANFALFRTPLGERFQSLTHNCPQLHLFEREIAEQFGVIPEGHPWLKPVRFHASWRTG